MEVHEIAEVCHEANRAYCMNLGDCSIPHWRATSNEHRKSIYDGVRYRIDNPRSSFEEQHEHWRDARYAEGWKWGLVKDVSRKEHPCLVLYQYLESEQKKKDALFCAIVDVLKEK